MSLCGTTQHKHHDALQDEDKVKPTENAVHTQNHSWSRLMHGNLKQ